MPDTKAGNMGSASHLGETQGPVTPISSTTTAAGVSLCPWSPTWAWPTLRWSPGAENPAKKALDRLRDLIEPAVIAEEELDSEHMEA